MKQETGNRKQATGFRYTKYAKIVAAMAKEYSVNPREVEDLIQETLAQVLADFDATKGKRFTNFLRMVAHRRIVDMIRGWVKAMPSLDAREKMYKREKDEAMLDGSAGPVTVAVKGGDLARVQKALLGLATEDQEVVSLKYVDGLSYEQIAEKRGVGVDEVRIAIERARRELKRKLAIYFTSRISNRVELQGLFEAIEELPSLYKSVFVLRHVEGLSADEVADKLAKSEGVKVDEKVVAARLQRAYGHIKSKAGKDKWQKIRALLGV